VLTAAQIAALDSLTFVIEDLDGKTLGEARDGVIVIDLDAAGFGWFVDATPYDDSEFGITVDADTLKSTGTSDAFGAMDLLTVVSHEIGHLLGFDHTDEPGGDALMDETLRAGVRLLPLDDEPVATADTALPAPAQAAPAMVKAGGRDSVAEPKQQAVKLGKSMRALSGTSVSDSGLAVAALVNANAWEAITVNRADKVPFVVNWKHDSDSRDCVFDEDTGAFRWLGNDTSDSRRAKPWLDGVLADWMPPMSDHAMEQLERLDYPGIDWGQDD
jgi:hypothetical protein